MIASWRIALRIARREARRARGRTALVFCMVALPVTAIVALDVMARTADLSWEESLMQELGDADALVRDDGLHAPVDQDPLMTTVAPREGGRALPRPGAVDVRSRLPGGARLVGLEDGDVALETPRGDVRSPAVGVDLSDPLARSLWRTVDGRMPDRPDEIAVTERLARLGLRPGTTVRRAGGARTLRIVGALRGRSELGPLAVFGHPASLGLTGGPTRWLVASPRPIGWDTVRRLNDRGLSVVSRAVVADPPPPGEVALSSPTSPADGVGVAVIGLIVAMALLQVVLLAGPAFAVGAQRQRRALALLAATGATPSDVRRVVLAGGVLIGGAATVAGTLLALALAFALRGLLDGDNPRGPFEVAPLDIAAVAAFGLVSAVLAALGPAVVAGRADVVAALAGRRGATRGSARSLTAGLLLLGAGLSGAVLAARGAGELAVAFSAVPTVLGAALLAPALLARAGRVAHRLPLPARLAVRDAARQRSRTAPAVAAIAATVAGVVALGVGASSDTAERVATYVPFAPDGAAVVTASDPAAVAWPSARAIAERELPGTRVTAVAGVPESTVGDRLERIDLCAPEGSGCRLASSSSSLGTQYPIGDAVLPFLELPAADEARARRVLSDGGVVVFAAAPLKRPRIALARVEDVLSGDVSQTRVLARTTAPAVRVAPSHQDPAPAAAVLSEQAAADLGVRPVTTALVATGAPIDHDAQDRAEAALGLAGGGLGIAVERGAEDGDDLRLVLLLLGAAGAVLVLGGTLTATLLALSEARPDFGTLMAVGATPGIRRATAACYAAAIGLLGALLGALAGLIPGIAVAYPLTGRRAGRPEGDGLPDVFIDVPWPLLAALVIGVPAFAALGVALFTRARLPLTQRQT